MPILFILYLLICDIFSTPKEEVTLTDKAIQEAFNKLNDSSQESYKQLDKSPENTFKSAIEIFITKHVHAIYSAEIDGLGTATIDNMRTTSSCISKKITKELEFLANHEKAFETAMIQLWLGDAEEEFWSLFQKTSQTSEIWPEIKRFTQEKIKLRFLKKKNIPAVILWSENFKLPFSKKIPTNHTTKFSFTVDDVNLLLALEDSIFAELSKILEHFKHKPLALKAITEGHIAWLGFRASLLSFYINLNIDQDIIKIRMACLHLSQLYFYKHFFAYFTKQPHETRCLALSPREYNDNYDCSIIRKPKNLPSELPCFPK